MRDKLAAWIRQILREEIKNHTERVSEDYEHLKDFIRVELAKRNETLVHDAAAAAWMLYSAKITMAICDHCGLASRRFSVSRIDSKIVCAECIAKGKK